MSRAVTSWPSTKSVSVDDYFAIICDNIMEPSRVCVFESVLTHAYMLFILFIAESKDHGDNGRRRGF